MITMLRWYITEMLLLRQYSIGWALHYGVPGRRWLIVPMFFQALIMATAWLVVSPIIRHPKPPVFRAWFIGRCHSYMRGDSIEKVFSLPADDIIFSRHQ